MVIKGGARGAPIDLAAHLQRLDTNERMEVLELRGVAADELEGALREMDAVASGTRCKRPLYHASINTAPDERMTPEQWNQAIDALEAKLGFTGQPRTVVFHEKEGREHVHIVWSRIDLEHMRAIPDSHNYRRHEEVARELEREFGHAHVQGAHVEREGKERPDRTPTHAEMQQAERTGLSPKEAKAEITAIWEKTDTGKAFAAALEDHNWILARGDKRDFVVLDHAGEVHSLARRIEGAKAKDVRERMADVDLAKLPSVEEARTVQLSRQVARDELTVDQALEAPAQEAESSLPGHALVAANEQPDFTAGPALRELGEAIEDTAAKGLHVADRAAGAVVKLTDFVVDILGGMFAPAQPRKTSAAEIAINAEARREHFRQQAAERERLVAIDRMRGDIEAGRNLDTASVRQLSRDDMENIKAKGDGYLRELIEERERELKRQRDYGGRERER